MPQNRNSAKPPEAMTWGKAMPMIVVAGVFDLVRIFFEMFWFFGPALVAAYCSMQASDWVGHLWGLTEAACTAAAGAAGFYGAAVTIPFGTTMAMATGLFGYLTIGLWILMRNPRIFVANASGSLWLAGGFGVSVVPLIGAIPAFSLVLWRLYRTQIHVEKAALKKWEKEHAAAKRQEREQQAAALARMQQQAATNDEVYGPSEAANDEQNGEDPDTERDVPLVHLPIFPTALNKVQEERIVQKTVGAQPQKEFHAEVVRKEDIAEKIRDNLQPISTEPKMSESHLSVQENMKKYNAYFVHMFQVTDTLDVSDNNKTLDTKKLSGTDRMDILYGISPTLSASTIRPHTTDRTFQGGFGVILGKGAIESAAPSDDGTIATSFENRYVIGGNKDREEDVERALNRSKDSNGYNEVVVKQPSISGSFMKLQDDDRISYEEESIDYGNFGGIRTRKVGILDMSDIMFGKRVEVSYKAPFDTLLAMEKRGQRGRMFLLNNKNEMLHITSIDEKTRTVKFDTVPVTPEDIVTHFSNGEIATDTKKEMADRLKEKGIANK